MHKFLNVIQKNQEVAQVDIYGEIVDSNKDWGMVDETVFGAKELKAELSKIENVKQIDIFINSPGGSVFAGQAIYSMLKRFPAKKTVYIDGIAASAASFIAMVGDEIIMPKNSMMMIHKPWTLAIGNSDEIMKVAEVLDQIEKTMLAVYEEKTGLTQEVIKDLLQKETWMTAEEAVANGFATKIEDEKNVVAFANKDTLNVNNVEYTTGNTKNFEELKTKIQTNYVKTVDKFEEKNNNKNISGEEFAKEILKFIKIMEEK